MAAKAPYASFIIDTAIILFDLDAIYRAGYFAKIASPANTRIDMRFEPYDRGNAMRDTLWNIF